MSQQHNNNQGTPADGPLKVDIDSVLRTRLPRHYRWIPRWLVRAVERMVCQDDINRTLEAIHPCRDGAFCRRALEVLDVDYKVDNEQNMPESPRAIFVSNHPLGGLDGIILIDMMTRHYGTTVKFPVNDLLYAIEPLSGVFLPVNKHGSQSREASSQLDEALASDAPVIIFPAGICSRRQKGGAVADLVWQKMFVNKAIKYQRPVIPLYFNGKNSNFFYKFANVRKRLGLKFNIEMIRLPKELFLSRGSRFSVKVGRPIAWESLKGGSGALRQAAEIRDIVYKLASESDE